jgi:hypothetical protein
MNREISSRRPFQNTDSNVWLNVNSGEDRWLNQRDEGDSSLAR